MRFGRQTVDRGGGAGWRARRRNGPGPSDSRDSPGPPSYGLVSIRKSSGSTHIGIAAAFTVSVHAALHMRWPPSTATSVFATATPESLCVNAENSIRAFGTSKIASWRRVGSVPPLVSHKHKTSAPARLAASKVRNAKSGFQRSCRKSAPRRRSLRDRALLAYSTGMMLLSFVIERAYAEVYAFETDTAGVLRDVGRRD